MAMENEMFGEDEIEDTSKTFLGVSFILLGFDPLRKQEIELKLFDGGATDAVNYGPHCTHVIVDKLIYDDPMCITARRDGKMLVTGLWVDHSFDVGMSLDPNAIIYRPLRDLNGIPGAESMTICLTGYHGPERADIMTMVGLMGATFSKPLVSQTVTHLICYKFEGEKYEVAKKLKIIKLVNHFWLIECLKAWAILPEADYAKSAYELEMETEVKDSEDETEDKTPIIAAGRKNITTPQNTRVVNKISNQLPMKPEIPKNSSYSSPSKLMADVDGNRNVQSTLKKKTDSGKRAYSRNKQDVSRSGLYSSPSKLLLNTEDDRNMESTHSKRTDPEKQEIPRNFSDSGPSKHFVDSSKVLSTPRKDTDPEMASNVRNKLEHSSFLNKLNNCNSKIQSTPVKGNIESLPLDNNDRQTETPRNSGKISSKTPSNMGDGDMVCEMAEQLLPFASESAKKKSPRSEVSKRSSGGLLRSTPRKPSLSPNSERIAGNLGARPSPSTIADKLQLASGNSNLPSETHQNGTDFQGKRPLKRTITNLQLDEDKTAFTSDKRKKTLSLGSAKSRKVSSDVRTTTERESGIEPKDLLASEFLRDGSLRLPAGQISPSRKGHLSCEGPSEPSEIRVASNKDERECNQEVIKSYQKGSKKRSLALNVEVNGNSVSRIGIGDSNREVVIHQRGTNHSFEPPFLNTSIPGEEASNQNTDLNFSKSENVVPPLRRKTSAKKTLGSRPSVGKGRTAIIKGPIGLKKATEDPISVSNEDDGMIMAVNINENKSETNKLHESCQEVIDEDETEAPDDKVDEFNGAINTENFAEVEPQDVGNLSSDDVVGLDDIGKQGNSAEDENGKEAEIAVYCKKTDLVESKSTGGAKGKTLPKAKKRPSTITKKRDNQPEKGKSKREEKKKTLADNEKTCVLSGETEASLPKKSKRSTDAEKENEPGTDNEKTCVLSGETEARLPKKLKRSTDAEKENEPTTLTHRNLSNVTGAVEKSTKKLKKSTSKILKVDNRYSGSTNLVVHDKIGKNEPACFILSGHRLQRKEFQQVIKRLKGKVCRDSHSWSYQATHLIIPDPIKRTEKFFAAVASGSWILKVDYLTASNEAGKLLSEEPYEWHKKGLSEDGAINLEAPRKWRLLRERTGHGAFYGMRIVIYGECIAPPLETLKRVIKAGGGTILATAPPYTRFFQSGIDFAVVSPSMLRVDIWVQEFMRHEVPCVLADYLVEYVCKPSYSLDRHVQYSTHSWAEKSLKSLISRVEEVPEDVPRTPEADETDDVACQVCGSRDRGDEMLICGDESGALGCGVGTHLDCLEPPLNDVPEDDWFCQPCRMKEVRISVGKSLSKRSSKSKSKK